MKFELIHSIRGRARWRAPRGFSLAAANALADLVEAVPGVDGVSVNPRSGSVLAVYSAPDCVAKVSAVLGAFEPRAGLHADVRAARSDQPKLDFGPLLRYVFVRPFLPMPWRIFNCVRFGLPYVAKAVRTVFSGRLNVEVLDGAAVGVCLARRDYRTAGLLMLLLGMGEMLENYTRKRSVQSLRDELAMQVDTVWIRREGVELQVKIETLTPEDLVIVRAGNSIPVDGVVAEGDGLVNQASMTGEPMPVHRCAGGSVFAGTVLEEGTLYVHPTKIGGETRLNRIVDYIEESEAVKASIQCKAERLADRIVPFSFLLAGAVYAITRDPIRASSVLLVDYSCALRLSTPLAILSAMREGARNGVLVKGGRFLEVLSEVDTVVFDKTGTLTRSSPVVSDVIPAGRMKADRVLALTACLEEHFPHPLARAIMNAANEQGLLHDEELHAEVQYVVAHGICSSVNGKRCVLGSAHFVCEDEGVKVSPRMAGEIARLADEGKSVLYLAVNGRLAGIIGIEDPAREESREVIAALRERGIRRIVMLTGDGERTAAAVAARLGVDEYRSQLLPEDKARILSELKSQGCRILMVGDGINDSPALANADVGATLRDGADLAQEVADVVLTHNSLTGLVTAIDLARSTMSRIRTNFRASVGLNTAFLAGGLTGVLTPSMSAVLHNSSTIGVCLNSMRNKL